MYTQLSYGQKRKYMKLCPPLKNVSGFTYDMVFSMIHGMYDHTNSSYDPIGGHPEGFDKETVEMIREVREFIRNKINADEYGRVVRWIKEDSDGYRIKMKDTPPNYNKYVQFLSPVLSSSVRTSQHTSSKTGVL